MAPMGSISGFFFGAYGVVGGTKAIAETGWWANELKHDIFNKTFETWGSVFVAEKAIFYEELKYLLHRAVERETAQEMMEDGNHDGWTFFNEWCRKEIPETQQAAYMAGQGAISKTMKELIRVRGKVAVKMMTSQHSSASIADTTNKPGLIARIAWGCIGKRLVQENLMELKRAVGTLERHRADVNLSSTKQKRPPLSQLPISGERRTDPMNFARREHTTHLYDTLATVASCDCHDVDLLLESNLVRGDPPTDGRTSIHFRLVISPEGSDVSLRITTTPCYIIAQSEWMTETQFQCASHGTSSAISSIVDAPKLTSSGHLCYNTTLHELRRVCLGVVQTPLSLFRLIQEPPGDPVQAQRISLASILADPDGIPLIDRLRAAHSLARSILQFSAWFQESWRNDDVVVFAHQIMATSAGYLSLPLHVHTSFNNNHRRRQSLKLREQSGIMISLALALTELGIGSKLSAIKSPAKIHCFNGDAISEYLQLKSIIERPSLLNRHVMPKYVEVVKRCFFWRGELSVKSGHDEFEKTVVRKLEEFVEVLRN